ncbi:hypothetical protein C1646_674458 [Rhizophagus diaphanus]|nr:hypothetical protein C1646_674458 [Rhizophagus diaphanus] [Rhizophagus sp. MUCL 43196]
MIEQFKIGDDFTISQERQHTIIVDGDVNDEDDSDDKGKETTSTMDENFGWSIDISNLYTKDVKSKCKYFIYVAVSRIVDKDLISIPEKTRNGTTIIYRLELENGNENYKHTAENTISYRISGISGICRFIHEFKSEKVRKLYFIENGLEAISKKFKSIEKIYLLEFIEDKKQVINLSNKSIYNYNSNWKISTLDPGN